MSIEIDYKINNIMQYLDKNPMNLDKKIFESILDILRDINKELDELNESINF